MRRFAVKGSVVVIDLAVLSLAYWLAFSLRFDWDPPAQMFKRLTFTLPYVIGLQYLLLVASGVTRYTWRHISLQEMTGIVASIGASTALLLCARAVAMAVLPTFGHAQYAHVPGGVILIDAVLVFVGVSGVRVFGRIRAERTSALRRRASDKPEVRSLLIGAGNAGVMVAKEIAARPDLNIKPVGFLDDDPVKLGTVLQGLQVLGTTEQIKSVAGDHEVRQAIIAIAHGEGQAIRRITVLCSEAGLETKIVPGLYEIVGGSLNLSRIRDVAIEDLLGREPVSLDLDAIASLVRGRVVMVTGAGGSIGSELCRQVGNFGPRELVLVEQAENNLFEIHRELLQSHAQAPIVPRVADICDHDRMAQLMALHRPKVLFHAAAHKHVPMMEWNPAESVKNNVFGTIGVADLAYEHEVERFVMISTDKAVNPTSVMGASKRAAEMYIQALSQEGGTRFVTVRFGNVLGSTGSVIPIFKRQIERGGPITVTHPEMQRYFMTIREACELVMQAASMGDGGEIFILDMGSPVKIVDLARDLIRLSGLRPGEDVDIVFSGMRPGEKLFEELSVADEAVDKTRHSKIFVGRIAPTDLEVISDRLAELQSAAGADDGDRIREVLATVVPEYQHQPSRDAPAIQGAVKAESA